MKIRYTSNCYKTKAEAEKNLGSANWKEIDGNYNMLISLYQSGHIVHISDTEYTDTIILDLDEMNDNQANDIHDIFYIIELTEKLGVEHIEAFDSSSRKYNKQKLFINTNMKRNIVDNKDLAYTEFRTKFEELTGIVCDSHMDSYTQITFGINLNDTKYYLPEDTFTNSIDSVQPKKIISDSDNLLLSTPPINNKMDKSLITFEKGQYIPLNQIEMNKRYGKEIRFEGRFDWSSIHYVGYRESTRTIIKSGSRHRTLGKLIKCVVYNGLNQNNKYDAGFTENDILTTVLGVIGKQFENHKAFLQEEGGSIRKQVHEELAHAKAKNLDDYYNEISADAKNKISHKYTPRSLSAKGLFTANIVFFQTCTNIEKINDKIGELAEGDVKIMNQIKRYYKQNVVGSIDSRKNNGHYADYDTYIGNCSKNNKNKIIVDGSHYHNANFRKWCKERNIKITKGK